MGSRSCSLARIHRWVGRNWQVGQCLFLLLAEHRQCAFGQQGVSVFPRRTPGAVSGPTSHRLTPQSDPPCLVGVSPGVRRGWKIADLLCAFEAHVQEQGHWQATSYAGYKPVAVDITAYWRPRLRGWLSKHYHLH